MRRLILAAFVLLPHTCGKVDDSICPDTTAPDCGCPDGIPDRSANNPCTKSKDGEACCFWSSDTLFAGACQAHICIAPVDG